MNRIILLVISIILAYGASAQCTPSANLTHSGFYPNPLPDGKVGVAYNQPITFQFPTDTTISFAGALQAIHIDSLLILSVNGFPASFSKTCNNADCKYYLSPLKGCMQISGVPTMADTGTKKLVITVVVKFKLGIIPIAYPITDSSQFFRVLPPNTGVSRSQVQSASFGIEQITPNPFTEKTTVTIAAPKAGKTILAIRDILGKEIYKQEVNCKAGSNNVVINTEEFKAGYYLLSMTSSEGVITKKITKR